MRLNCPGCGAQYEIEGSAIPDEGRDVQCSGCGHGWFQYPPITAYAFGAPEPFVPRAAPPPEPKPKPEPKPEIAKPTALEDIRAFLRQEAQHEAEKRRAEGEVPPPPPKPTPKPDRGPEPEPRPDPVAIDSLRPVRRGGRSGFGLGFFGALVMFLLIAGIYVSAPRIAEALPELRDPLASYVAFLDQGRSRLADFARQVTTALRS